jgi:hypothetical protein
LGYIRDQLHTEVNLDLPVHLVSVAVGDTQLCDQWYEKALKPLLESSQQNVGSSLKRKIGGLREAVEQVLQQRTESPHRSRPPASDQAAKNALEALRTADAMIEMAMRESYRVADKIRSLDERMIKAVSEDILTAWNSAEAHPKEPGEIVATTLCREFSLQGTGCLDTVLNIRDRLMQTLHTVREASLLAYESDEMPKASGLPLIDPSPLVHLIVLKRPTLLRVFGRSALRRYVRRELSRQLVESLPSFLNNAGKSLEQWYRLALANLQKAFGANAEIYRLRLLQLQEAPTAEDADNGLQNDLAVLRKWIA